MASEFLALKAGPPLELGDKNPEMKTMFTVPILARSSLVSLIPLSFCISQLALGNLPYICIAGRK